MELDRPDVPRGGHPRGGGSVHLSFRSGSRAHGSAAASSYAYITRSGRYDGEDRDPVVYTESGHMPSWAEPDPQVYWEAADLYERANGRLFVRADFALPRELSPDDQRELAEAFVHDLTDPERLPYTMAIHAGLDTEGRSHNPHVHLMFSERQHDGLERTAETWFKRANRQEPERGGAPKSRTFHGSEWVERARATWAQRTNEALARAGSPTRVDHRSYERQGLDRVPQRHIGPAAIHAHLQGRPHDRLEAAWSVEDLKQAIQDVDRQIAELMTERDAVAREVDAEERPYKPWDPSGSRGDRDDSSRGR